MTYARYDGRMNMAPRAAKVDQHGHQKGMLAAMADQEVFRWKCFCTPDMRFHMRVPASRFQRLVRFAPH
jgi:hypothetical protein